MRTEAPRNIGAGKGASRDVAARFQRFFPCPRAVPNIPSRLDRLARNPQVVFSTSPKVVQDVNRPPLRTHCGVEVRSRLRIGNVAKLRPQRRHRNPKHDHVLGIDPTIGWIGLIPSARLHSEKAPGRAAHEVEAMRPKVALSGRFLLELDVPLE